MIYEELWRHMMGLCTVAACAAAYKSWDDKYSRGQIQNAWSGANKIPRLKVTIEELRALTEEQRTTLGIGKWDDTLLLLPIWMFPCIADGEQLVSISHKIKTVGVDNIDLDVRFGCISWGFSAP